MKEKCNFYKNAAALLLERGLLAVSLDEMCKVSASPASFPPLSDSAEDGSN